MEQQRMVLPALAAQAQHGPSSVPRLLDVALRGLRDLVPLVGCAVWTVDPETGGLRPDPVQVGDRPADASAVPVLDRLLAASGPLPLTGPVAERASTWVLPLLSAGSRLGVLGLAFSRPVPADAVCADVLDALSLHVAWALERAQVDSARREAGRAAEAFRQLLEEGSRAMSVRAAGHLLAAATARAFSTERAGVYLVDADGVISHAVGVGVSPELSDALARSLVGKRARESPVWRSTELALGPVVVSDASAAAVRPGGFVQAMEFVSYVAIPLLSKDGPLGLVIVGDTSRPRVWTAFEHDLARQLALEGALVVDTARLRQSEHARLRELTHQASHDGLTGLPNREVLLDRMAQLASRGTDGGRGFGLLLLDLNDFKQVNDRLGHHSGDLLLTSVAARLAGLSDVDVVARLGGDEFALLVSGVDAPRRAEAVAAEAQRRLAAPFELGEQRLHIASSVGIALCPEHATDATALMQTADVAMYEAKRRGAGTVLYDPALDVLTLDTLVVYSELHEALSEGELRLHYQPKVALDTGLVCGVEALVRWQHPRRGLLGPGDFLPVAEATDLIHPLTAWVLRTAVAQWRTWRDAGRLLDVSVNVSVLNLRDESFARLLDEVLADPDVARSLVLEITETAVMTDLGDVQALLQRLHRAGVRISMDDFGAGHSSLSQLRQLPVDELKIDRLLVTEIGRNRVDRAIVRTIVELGHHLHLSVVAEGVEDAAALDVLRQLGCDCAQGYFLSRPMPADDLFPVTARRA